MTVQAPAPPAPVATGRRPAGGAALAGLTAAALGVVFGDIGTSPLYALQVVYSLDGGVVAPTPGTSTASSRSSSGRSR